MLSLFLRFPNYCGYRARGEGYFFRIGVEANRRQVAAFVRLVNAIYAHFIVDLRVNGFEVVGHIHEDGDYFLLVGRYVCRGENFRQVVCACDFYAPVVRADKERIVAQPPENFVRANIAPFLGVFDKPLGVEQRANAVAQFACDPVASAVGVAVHKVGVNDFRHMQCNLHIVVCAALPVGGESVELFGVGAIAHQTPFGLMEFDSVFLRGGGDFFADFAQLFVFVMGMVAVCADLPRERFQVADIVFACGVEECVDLVVGGVLFGVLV